jgi:hypothetical protein
MLLLLPLAPFRWPWQPSPASCAISLAGGGIADQVSSFPLNFPSGIIYPRSPQNSRPSAAAPHGFIAVLACCLLKSAKLLMRRAALGAESSAAVRADGDVQLECTDPLRKHLGPRPPTICKNSRTTIVLAFVTTAALVPPGICISSEKALGKHIQTSTQLALCEHKATESRVRGSSLHRVRGSSLHRVRGSSLHRNHRCSWVHASSGDGKAWCHLSARYLQCHLSAQFR